MRIIPAIDIIEGKCVRLTQGDYNQKVIYNEDPLEVAKEFEANGIKFLHLVDLDGAKAKSIVNAKVLEKVCNNTSLKVDFGGGIKTVEDVQLAFDCGANQITAGSIAATDSDKVGEWIMKYGGEKIILGADVTENKRIAINGWKDETKFGLMDFIDSFTNRGIESVICTDITVDGMLTGPSVTLYNDILDQFPELDLIASGGVGGIKDVEILEASKVKAVIIGKAFYENRLTFKEIRKYVD
jgi:phosphoribosylformimino-5-aminoimidazole carboxamide ribotide isomerase